MVAEGWVCQLLHFLCLCYPGVGSHQSAPAVSVCVCVCVCVFSITSIKFYLLLLSFGAGVGHPPGVVCVFVSAVACYRPAQTCNSPAVTWAISSYSKPITAEL